MEEGIACTDVHFLLLASNALPGLLFYKFLPVHPVAVAHQQEADPLLQDGEVDFKWEGSVFQLVNLFSAEVPNRNIGTGHPGAGEFNRHLVARGVAEDERVLAGCQQRHHQ